MSETQTPESKKEKTAPKRDRAQYFRDRRKRIREERGASKKIFFENLKQFSAEEQEKLKQRRKQMRSYWRKNKLLINERRRRKRENLKQIGEPYQHLKNPNCWSFVLKHRKTNQVSVETRVEKTSAAGRTFSILADRQFFDSLDEAFSYVQSIESDPYNPEDTKNLRGYRTVVERLMREIEEISIQPHEKQKTHLWGYVPKTLGFLFAIRDFRDETLGSKGVDLQDNMRSQRESILRVLGNVQLPQGYFLANSARQMLDKLAKQGRTQSVTTFTRKARELAAAFDIVAEMPLVFSEHQGLLAFSALLRQFTDVVRNENRYSESTGSGNLRNEENHEPFLRQECEKLLRGLARYDLAVFNYMILGLSTCLRPVELKRLVWGGYFKTVDNKKEFVGCNFMTETGELDYKCGHLVTKTSAKVNPKNLENPIMSLVTRLILRKECPIRIPTPSEMSPNGNSIRNLIDDGLSEVYPRRLRATGATMLRFCVLSKNKIFLSTSIHDVQNRCAHRDTTMVARVYAKKIPTQKMTPEKFFEITASSLQIKGQDLRPGQTPWDAFLFKLWYAANRAAMPTTELQEKFDSLVFEEYDAYLRDINWGEQDEQEAG